MVYMSATLLDGIHGLVSAHGEILCILRVLHRIHGVTDESALEDDLIWNSIFIAVEVSCHECRKPCSNPAYRTHKYFSTDFTGLNALMVKMGIEEIELS